MILKLITFLGAACYLGAFACAEMKKPKIEKILWSAGIAVSALLVGKNWIANGYVPFVSMYQVLTFLSLTFSPIYLTVKYLMNGSWLAKYFQITAGLVLTGVGFMDATDVWSFPPALQSVWFIPHVLAYMIGYTLTAVACAVTVVSFFKKKEPAGMLSEEKINTEIRRSKLAKQREEKLKAAVNVKSEREIMRDGSNSLARIAFPFMTSGMFLGAFWANQVWGNYWSWDLKESWALITWLLMMLYLHFYKDKKLKKFTPLLIILACVGVIVTMLFVNVFTKGSTSLHSYSI